VPRKLIGFRFLFCLARRAGCYPLPRTATGLFCCTGSDMDLTATRKIANTSRKRLKKHGAYLVPISAGVAIIIWYFVARFGGFPAFILPSPVLVWNRFLSALLEGRLAYHIAVTLGEVLAGLAIGVTAATTLGYLLAKSETFERLFAPYIVASQSIPIVAIAPLLVLWFGPGLLSKVLICALIVFFPVLIASLLFFYPFEAQFG